MICLWRWFCGSKQRDGKSTDIRASVGQSTDNSLVNVYKVFLDAQVLLSFSLKKIVLFPLRVCFFLSFGSEETKYVLSVVLVQLRYQP